MIEHFIINSIRELFFFIEGMFIGIVGTIIIKRILIKKREEEKGK